MSPARTANWDITVESITMNNSLFRKQVKVNFHANRSISEQVRHVYAVDSGVVMKKGDTVPVCVFNAVYGYIIRESNASYFLYVNIRFSLLF